VTDLLCAIGDALAWAADNLLAPILTGVFVGVALRWAAISGEVTEHDARAEELNTDLTRWVRDRNRELVAQIFSALNLARQGIIEDVAPAPVPKELEGTRPGSQEDSGAFLRRIGRLMRDALHEYRDQASRSVRTYRAMARSEGWLHGQIRRRRLRRAPSPLRLSKHSRELLDTWRSRNAPVRGEPDVIVDDDPTRQDDAADIRPLEDPGGLTWDAARRADRSEP
jgi:hypothetical protein